MASPVGSPVDMLNSPKTPRRSAEKEAMGLSAPEKSRSSLWTHLDLLFKPHPWHGISIGPHAPEAVTVYLELVPTDTIKYEVDKDTGYLKIDRPQKYSNVSPVNYGFIPQTLCGQRIAALAHERSGKEVVGDGDPLDICVLSDHTISHGDLLLTAIPIGGLCMLDDTEADDKIIAVLKGDGSYGHIRDISELPRPILDRIRHYFQTYKQGPDVVTPVVELTNTYGREEAFEVIRRSQEDYKNKFGNLRDALNDSLISTIIAQIRAKLGA